MGQRLAWRHPADTENPGWAEDPRDRTSASRRRSILGPGWAGPHPRNPRHAGGRFLGAARGRAVAGDGDWHPPGRAGFIADPGSPPGGNRGGVLRQCLRFFPCPQPGGGVGDPPCPKGAGQRDFTLSDLLVCRRYARWFLTCAVLALDGVVRRGRGLPVRARGVSGSGTVAAPLGKAGRPFFHGIGLRRQGLAASVRVHPGAGGTVHRPCRARIQCVPVVSPVS